MEHTNAPVRPGDVVAGKYRIERTIGVGGMGFVVAARHLALDEWVALKFVLSHHTENREIVERLMREARATFRLRNMHTVRVHDVGELPTGDLYIVMELLEGRDLRAELLARGPLPVSEVVSYALDACESLREAHALGIVHRDLKPANLFLAKSAQGRDIVKVLDFGMSKLDPALHEAGPLTRPETALGTPRYMAPEQWKSASSVDQTADIWALGIVMYELLTGKTPFHDMRANERQARLLGGAIPSPCEARPDVPEALARVVLRCLRADPRARWGSVVQVSSALRAAFPQTRTAGGDFVEVTRTGVTAVVPPSEQARRAAKAFDPINDPRSAASPATRPETPEARALPVPSSEPTPVMQPIRVARPDDFELATEVRAPMFTPGDSVADSGHVPVTRAPKRMAETLRSFEAPAEIVQAVAELVPPPVERRDPPQEATLRLPSAPLDRPKERTLPLPIAASVPPAAWPPRQVVTPPLPEPPRRKSSAAHVVLAGLAALVVSGVLGWVVVRLLTR